MCVRVCVCVCVCVCACVRTIPGRRGASRSCSGASVSSWCSLIGVCSYSCSLPQPLPLLLVFESTKNDQFYKPCV